MIDYLTYFDYARYDPNIAPSRQGTAGGMQSKTYRVREALDAYYPGSKVVSNIEEITAPVVLIEPLSFFMLEDPEAELNKLKMVNAKKIVYGSEYAPMRMSPSMRSLLFDNVDLVTANCYFLKRLLTYIGIDASHILTDPMSEVFSPPESQDERKNRIVAMGQVSAEKNTKQVTEVFKRLEGVAERVYIGSASLWGPDPMRAKQLEEELFEHCDRILPDAKPSEIAVELQQAKVGYWCAFHDTWSTCTHEMIACGLPVIAANHGLAEELPVTTASEIDDQIRLIQETLTLPSDEYLKLSASLDKWNRENASYAVFLSQLQTVLRRVF